MHSRVQHSTQESWKRTVRVTDSAWGARTASQRRGHLVRVLKDVREPDRWRNVEEIF